MAHYNIVLLTYLLTYSTDVDEQSELSLSDGGHRCPLPDDLSSHFIVCHVVVQPFDACGSTSGTPTACADHRLNPFHAGL